MTNSKDIDQFSGIREKAEAELANLERRRAEIREIEDRAASLASFERQADKELAAAKKERAAAAEVVANPDGSAIGGGGGSNASVGANGATAPASSTQLGSVDGAGKLRTTQGAALVGGKISISTFVDGTTKLSNIYLLTGSQADFLSILAFR